MEEEIEDSQQFAKGKAVDVLIIGAGPTGFMAAATLARYGVPFRIIDKRAQHIFRGHASGIQPRTAEILHSLGFQPNLAIHGSAMTETSFWSGTKSGITRKTSPEAEVINATPYPYVVIMHQGHTETMFIEDLTSRGILVDRPVAYIDHTNGGKGEYPLKARLKDWISGMTEEIPVKYILGCDGAGSAVRQQLSIGSSVHHTNDSWAVADVHCKTNFPDVGRRCTVRTEHGSLMLIPYADDRARLYTLLNKEEHEALLQSKYDGKGEKHTNNQTVIGVLKRRVDLLLKPYVLEITEVEWVSMYQIAQRISSSFAKEDDRVFILGDACHTHSPKAAQGMNVSMNDAYNLTWKLALALRGLANRSLLQTYQIERQHIAKQLIEFDEKFSHLFAAQGNLEDPGFHDVYVQNKGFTSGCGHQYPASLLTDENTDVPIIHEAAEPLTPGKRLLPVRLTRHVDGASVSLMDDMPSNGHFRIVAFAGSSLQTGFPAKLSSYLSGKDSALTLYSTPSRSTSSANSSIPKAKDMNYNPAKDPATIIDLFLIHTSPHLETAIEDLPAPFPEWQATIYEDADHQAHSQLGIDVNIGAMVVVRPDGYVGLVTRLDGVERVRDYFGRVLIGGVRGEL
ncbi:FAD binding domain-containing protein [Usnea florida]